MLHFYNYSPKIDQAALATIALYTSEDGPLIYYCPDLGTICGSIEDVRSVKNQQQSLLPVLGKSSEYGYDQVTAVEGYKVLHIIVIKHF